MIIPLHNIGRSRASSAPHTIGNRQHHRHRIQQWHNLKETHKSHGYAFLLDKRQSKTGAIKCVLGPRIPKFGRLFHKTPFAGASQNNARNIYIHASEQPMNRKGIRDFALRGWVNTSGKASAHIPPPGR
jgi:hypothetical protein